MTENINWHNRMLSNMENNTSIETTKFVFEIICVKEANSTSVKATNDGKKKNKCNDTYTEEMWTQSSNRIFCNVRGECVECCAKGKHTNLTVGICYPGRYAPTKHLQFDFGWNFIHFWLNYFGGNDLKMEEKKWNLQKLIKSRRKSTKFSMLFIMWINKSTAYSFSIRFKWIVFLLNFALNLIGLKTLVEGHSNLICCWIFRVFLGFSIWKRMKLNYVKHGKMLSSSDTDRYHTKKKKTKMFSSWFMWAKGNSFISINSQIPSFHGIRNDTFALNQVVKYVASSFVAPICTNDKMYAIISVPYFNTNITWNKLN